MKDPPGTPGATLAHPGTRRVAMAAFTLWIASFALAQELVVFAASSLTESFEQIAAAFEARHDGVEILLNFDGSSTLALQILQGAPADVFASANPAQMQRVVADDLVAAAPRAFATNRLVILTPAASDLRALADLARHGVRLVLAAPEVPVGAYAREAIASLAVEFGPGFAEQVLANLVSEEPNVRQVAARVELGEVDAAIVYATDARMADDARTIAIPEPHNVIAVYPIAALRRSNVPDLAEAFVAFALSAEAQAILAGHGFLPPE